jgi:uncharacterized protein YkwD
MKPAHLLLTFTLLLGLTGCGLGGFDPLGLFEGESASSGPPGDTMSASEHDLALQVFHLTNAQRQAAGVPLLVWDEGAAQVAFDHCADMRLRNYYAHESPDGETHPDRLRDGGISFWMAGENLYRQHSAADAAGAVWAWMGSDGHRRAMLRESYTRLGVGMHTDGRTTWWAQILYTP